MKSLVILLFLTLGVSLIPYSFAMDNTISDQNSCNALGLNWIAPNICTLDNTLTIDVDDTITIATEIYLDILDFGIIKNNGTIVNYGTVHNFGTIYNNIFQNKGGSFDNDGLIYNEGILDNGIYGTLNNDGSIIGNGEINNDSIISPYSSPLKQFKSGIQNYKTVCNKDLRLFIKPNTAPVCVTYDTAVKLQTRWSIPVIQSTHSQDSVSKNDMLVSDLPPIKSIGLQVDVTGQKQVRRGTTHDITVDVTRNQIPVPNALVRITIEDYGDDIIREYKSKTDESGRFVFSWEIPKSFDDIETLFAYVDVTDNISAKTTVFKFQVYCLPGESGCKVKGR